jgi:hypothetical protein
MVKSALLSFSFPTRVSFNNMERWIQQMADTGVCTIQGDSTTWPLKLMYYAASQKHIYISGSHTSLYLSQQYKYICQDFKLCQESRPE